MISRDVWPGRLELTASQPISLFHLDPLDIPTDQLTKKFGQGWNVIIGKHYASDAAAVSGTVLKMYYQGVYGIDIWKNER